MVDQTSDRLSPSIPLWSFYFLYTFVREVGQFRLMCFSLDGQLLYVPLYNANKLQVISLATLTTTDLVPLTVSPTSLAAGSDGALYAMANGQITKIDPTTGQTLGAVSWSFYSPIIKANTSGTRLYIMELDCPVGDQ